jgi:hypothetical protein
MGTNLNKRRFIWAIAAGLSVWRHVCQIGLTTKDFPIAGVDYFFMSET